MRVSEVFTTGGKFSGGDDHYFYGYYSMYPYPSDRFGPGKYYYYNGYNFGGYTYFGRDRRLGKL